MSNYNIRLNLSLLPGAFPATLEGKTASKKCLCIPIDDARLFQGKNGLYLDLSAIEMRDGRFGDTHLIKPALPKEDYAALSEEERKALPIVGSLKPFSAAAAVAAPTMHPSDEDDLPF